MKKLFFIFTLSTLHLTPYTLHSAFLEHGGQTKSVSVGRCGTVYSTDVEAILLNPAGLASITPPRATATQIVYEYNKLFSGLSDAGSNIPGYFPVNLETNFVGCAIPIRDLAQITNFGFAYSNFKAVNQYSESIFAAAIAKDIRELVRITENEKLTAGLNIKYLIIEYKKDKYTQNEIFRKYANTVSGISFDLGLKYNLYNFVLGIVAKNVYPLNIGVIKQETIPQEFNLGVLYTFDRFGFLSPITFMTELNTRTSSSGTKLRLNIGTEFGIMQTINFRTGFNSSEVAFGLGFELKQIECNYSFVLPYKLIESAKTHRFQIALYW